MCFGPSPFRPPLFRVVLFSILQFIEDNTLFHVTLFHVTVLRKHTNGKNQLMTLSKFFQYKITKIKNDVVITTYGQISLRNTRQANHWHGWKLTFCNYFHKYNPFLVFHKDMS